MKSFIKVNNISKRYRLGFKAEKSKTLVGKFKDIAFSPLMNFKRLYSLNDFRRDNDSIFWALKNIDFEVKQGEVLGIVGKNGAGKSTLLKILSGITDPTAGRIEINGRVGSLLEVGTGFHPELTGRENIFMNGTILGMSKFEIISKIDEIIEFSGIEKFIDTPVKFYSSGMKVRLGFSVAAHLEPEILIIDEVLAVGDFEFQKRCLGKMEDVSKNQGRTVLFVSHNMGAVSSLCSRLLLLSNGETIFDGNVSSGIKKYLTNDIDSNLDLEPNDNGFKLMKFEIYSIDKSYENVIPHNFDFILDFSIAGIKNTQIVNFSLMLFTFEGERISTIHLNDFNFDSDILSFKIKVKGNVLIPDDYYFDFQINNGFDVLYFKGNALAFSVFDNGSQFFKYKSKDVGRVFLDYQVV